MSDIRFNRWLHQSGTGGIYQDASGRVGIGSSVPSQALTVVGNINSSGKVGIGTDNPSSILHLNSNATAEVKLTLQNNNGTTAIYGNNDDIIMDADRYRIRDINGSAEYIRIVSGGGVGINTNLVTADTNVAVGGTIRVQNSADASQYLTISHQGINFQNTGAGSSTTSSAHLLDDYEEGTFTPTLEGGTSYTHQNGYYTKVGSQVYFYIRVEASAATGNSNRWQIFGLPYSSSSTDTAYGGAFRNYGDHFIGSNFPNLNFHITTNSSNIRAYDGQTTLLSNNSNINLTRQIILQGFYRTDS